MIALCLSLPFLNPCLPLPPLAHLLTVTFSPLCHALLALALHNITLSVLICLRKRRHRGVTSLPAFSFKPIGKFSGPSSVLNQMAAKWQRALSPQVYNAIAWEGSLVIALCLPCRWRPALQRGPSGPFPKLMPHRMGQGGLYLMWWHLLLFRPPCLRPPCPTKHTITV